MYARKHGLLPQHPEEEVDGPGPTECTAALPRSLRRPADIYVRRWRPSGAANGVAFDVALTAFIKRQAMHRDPGPEAVNACLTKYKEFKQSHLDTNAQCSVQGLQFVPLIFDSHGGGWHHGVNAVLSEVAQRLEATRRVQGKVAGISLTERLSQQLSVVIQSCIARGTLRRSAGALDLFQ